MYLKVEQGSKEEHLRKINQLILKLFEYAAEAAQFNPEEFEQFAGKDEVWSTKCYTPSSKFYNRMKKLFGFSSEERRKIYRVIQHDMEFDRHVEDSDFVFKEAELGKRQKETARELILYLYDNLFRKGKFVIQNQITGYLEFKESLFERNLLSICPVCLTMQTNMIEYGEVDHYFPKKNFPALIFHPMNLAVICGECNGFMVKGEKNTFEKSNLTELYIPYLRNAEKEVKLTVRKIEENGKNGERKRARKMVMVPRVSDDSGLIKKRIQNLDSLYDLSKRWTYRMETIITCELEYLENEKLESSVKKQLHDKAAARKKQAEKNKTMLLEAAAFSYIEKEGRESFLADWRMRQKEKEAMKDFWI